MFSFLDFWIILFFCFRDTDANEESYDRNVHLIKKPEMSPIVP